MGGLLPWETWFSRMCFNVRSKISPSCKSSFFGPCVSWSGLPFWLDGSSWLACSPVGVPWELSPVPISVSLPESRSPWFFCSFGLPWSVVSPFVESFIFSPVGSPSLGLDSLPFSLDSDDGSPVFGFSLGVPMSPWALGLGSFCSPLGFSGLSACWPSPLPPPVSSDASPSEPSPSPVPSWPVVDSPWLPSVSSGISSDGGSFWSGGFGGSGLSAGCWLSPLSPLLVVSEVFSFLSGSTMWIIKWSDELTLGSGRAKIRRLSEASAKRITRLPTGIFNVWGLKTTFLRITSSLPGAWWNNVLVIGSWSPCWMMSSICSSP